jgi:hypothetical protein
MELASMLAGEPFSDHPRCACPVISGLMRAYNDAVDDDRRQDLYAYAARVVGTAGPPEVRRARAERCAAWAADRRRARAWWRRWTRPTPAFGDGADLDAAGSRLVRTLGRIDDATHADVLALVDQLIAIGRRPAEEDLPALPAGRERRALATA